MSDFRVTFDTLSKISKTPSDVASFVTGSGLIKILGEVGTHHEQAAIEVLWDSTASPHPRDRVNSAANSLTEAFALLSPRYQTSVSRFFNQLMYQVAQEQLYARSAICAVLVAVCYTYLGESKSSRAKWLKLAEEELTGWKSMFFCRNQLTISARHYVTEPNPAHVKSAAEILEKFETIKQHLLTALQEYPPAPKLVEPLLPLPETNRTTSILFIATDPSDTSRLRLGEEFREIQEKLNMAKLRDQFKLELPQLSVRVGDLSSALLNMKPQIVHFSGHGMPNGALCFENQIGETQLVSPDALAELFRQFMSHIDCVLLNDCFVEMQAKAISRHIDFGSSGSHVVDREKRSLP